VTLATPDVVIIRRESSNNLKIYWSSLNLCIYAFRIVFQHFTSIHLTLYTKLKTIYFVFMGKIAMFPSAGTVVVFRFVMSDSG